MRLIYAFIIALLLTTLSISLLNRNTSLAAQPAMSFYFAPDGHDTYSCNVLQPCKTIDIAIPMSDEGDTFYLAKGVYTRREGEQVVTVYKSLNFSGGWNKDFTSQVGLSTIDGQDQRRGMLIRYGVSVVASHLAVQNGRATQGAGILNNGSLTLLHSTVRWNRTTNSRLHPGGGIYNSRKLVLTDSSISENTAATGAGIYNEGNFQCQNCTINDNIANVSGGGIYNNDQMQLVNTTISGNYSPDGGGIYSNSQDLSMLNSILVGNQSSSNFASNCHGSLASLGFNLFGSLEQMEACNISYGEGDLNNPEPILGSNIGFPEYLPLLTGSPAIDQGNPAGCENLAGEPLLVDQRGAERVERCDIGAYEYTPAGAVARINIRTGSPQKGVGKEVFPERLSVYVTDRQGTPVEGVPVTFNAPSEGPSGTFANTGTVTDTALTDSSGIAQASDFSTNGVVGSYSVLAVAEGIENKVKFMLTNTGEHVFVPLGINRACSIFFDNFSDPSSGWYSGEDDYVRGGYLDGEYRVQTKKSGYLYLFFAPACKMKIFILEVDARWAGVPGNSYGLVYRVSDSGAYSLFHLNTEDQVFEGFSRNENGSWSTIVQPRYSPAIHPGKEWNHIEITTNNNASFLKVNGVQLGVWSSTSSGSPFPGGFGLVVSAYGGNKDTDARFDNFRVTHFGAWDSQSALPSLESLACPAYPPVKIELPEELLFVPQE